MKYSIKDLDNTMVINAKGCNEEVIKAFKARGVDTGLFLGHSQEDYYGLVKGEFTIFNKKDVPSGIIMMPLEQFLRRYPLSKDPGFKRGDIVLVRQHKDHSWVERVFLCEVENAYYPVICVTKGDLDKFIKGEKVNTHDWKFIKKKGKEIPEPIVEPIVEPRNTFQTKFGLEQEVYLLSLGKIKKDRIKIIKPGTIQKDGKWESRYHLWDYDYEVSENKLYDSKEKLIASLEL